MSEAHVTSGVDVSIIIPVYNALPLTRQCVASIFEHGSALRFEVIVVDNGSAPDVQAWCGEQAAAHADFRCERYDEPLGFARAVNAGAAAATGDVLIVLNSDTIVTPKWMDTLYGELMADPSIGALSPVTNHAGEPAQMDYGTVDLSAEKALAHVANSPRKREVFYLPQRITFFCVAVRREVWLEFDGLDESYEVGNFEDDDLCLRLRMRGYRLAVARHAFVFHHNNATFSANKISHAGWMTKNAATFARKARAMAEMDPAEREQQRRWLRVRLTDISVVILPGDGPLERTLRSLQNQTIYDFEIIEPGSDKLPGGEWIAYLQQGDIAYPFHLEALHDALLRNGAEAIYADGWVKDAGSAESHPDVSRHVRKSPLLLPGWMHHASLQPDAAYDETMPIHWPRLTWEMQAAPEIVLEEDAGEKRGGAVEAARQMYRRMVPLETRHEIDRKVRKLIGRPLPDPETRPLRELTTLLRDQVAKGVNRGSFGAEKSLPAVFMFNSVAWDSITQRQHHFAHGLAERGHPVFWIETVLTPPRNWKVSRPLQELAPNLYMLRMPSMAREIYTIEWNDATVDAMCAALEQTCSAYGIAHALAVVNYPRWQPVAARMRELHGWQIASDCVDDQRAFAGIYQTTILSYEEWLVTQADVLLTSSILLKERLHKRPCVLLHNACDYELFGAATPMGFLDDRARPVVGFFGAMANWLDMDLIHAAAKRYADWTFIFIGAPIFSHPEVEAQWRRTVNLPNITVKPQMDLRSLAGHLAEFDVCTMPFKDIEATRAMNPVKLYEYCAAGKPVVARDLPEARYLVDREAAGLVYLYSSEAEYFESLERAASESDPTLRERRKEFARNNTWDHRVDVLSKLLVELSATQPNR